MNTRQRICENEERVLSGFAVLSSRSKGRARGEPECEVRTCFQRDIDRIIHSKSFRRLKHKTQVFLRPEGDHYRTRLTHTLEVTRIARTIARALGLNEDLTEAGALGHDLGHTPFGHAGELVLNEVLPGGFSHNSQSVRAAERLEKNGLGLNLTLETLDAMQCHTGEREASTLEGRIIRFADRIAYINHDIDDAVRAGVLSASDIPKEFEDALGDTCNRRIDTLVRDVVSASLGRPEVAMSPSVFTAMMRLRAFMFEAVYKNPVAKSEESKAKELILSLFGLFSRHPERLPPDFRRIADEEGPERAACDYIAGMTDNFAVSVFAREFVPEGWHGGLRG